MTYFCFELLGFSGIVISTSDFFNRGFKISFLNRVLLVLSEAFIKSVMGTGTDALCKFLITISLGTDLGQTWDRVDFFFFSFLIFSLCKCYQKFPVTSLSSGVFNPASCISEFILFIPVPQRSTYPARYNTSAIPGFLRIELYNYFPMTGFFKAISFIVINLSLAINSKFSPNFSLNFSPNFLPTLLPTFLPIFPSPIIILLIYC